MKILVCSCDRNEYLWEPFHHCLEKYWPNHPQVFYATETKINPYYETLCVNIPNLAEWTRRIWKTVEKLPEEPLLVMVDDVFLSRLVDVVGLAEIERQMTDTTASINLQVMSEARRQEGTYVGHNIWLMPKDSSYRVCIMCGLWNRIPLLEVLKKADRDPWALERANDGLSYNYYRLDHALMEWCGGEVGGLFGVFRGKWIEQTKKFLLQEGISESTFSHNNHLGV